MNLNQRIEYGVCVVEPAGRIDTASFPAFSERLRRCVEEGHPRILINLRRTEYISSCVLGLFQTCRKETAARGGEMAFCCVNERLAELFRVVRLEEWLRMYPCEDEALRALGPAPKAE